MKVRVLSERVKHVAKEMGLKDEDMVFVDIEKVEGSPTEYLKDRFLDGGIIFEKCPDCKGTGDDSGTISSAEDLTPCGACDGTGEVPAKKQMAEIKWLEWIEERIKHKPAIGNLLYPKHRENLAKAIVDRIKGKE